MNDPTAELFADLPGCTPMSDDAIAVITKNSFVSGDPTGARLRVAWFVRTEGLGTAGRAWFRPAAQGPPRHAHGGAMAALLDEVMGFACWLRGHRVLAKSITIEFRRPLPLETIVTFDGSVDRVDGNRVMSRGQLLLPSGVVCAEGTGVFVVLSAERMSRMVGPAR